MWLTLVARHVEAGVQANHKWRLLRFIGVLCFLLDPAQNILWPKYTEMQRHALLRMNRQQIWAKKHLPPFWNLGDVVVFIHLFASLSAEFLWFGWVYGKHKSLFFGMVGAGGGGGGGGGLGVVPCLAVRRQSSTYKRESAFESRAKLALWTLAVWLALLRLMDMYARYESVFWEDILENNVFAGRREGQQGREREGQIERQGGGG